MHVNRAVTLAHCQRLKEGKKPSTISDGFIRTYGLPLKTISVKVKLLAGCLLEVAPVNQGYLFKSPVDIFSKASEGNTLLLKFNNLRSI